MQIHLSAVRFTTSPHRSSYATDSVLKDTTLVCMYFWPVQLAIQVLLSAASEFDIYGNKKSGIVLPT